MFDARLHNDNLWNQSLAHNPSWNHVINLYYSKLYSSFVTAM
ncbi:MAG: hypothetical protein ACKER6_00795 [Candidatus Hodgkinia cicadicola]